MFSYLQGKCKVSNRVLHKYLQRLQPGPPGPDKAKERQWAGWQYNCGIIRFFSFFLDECSSSDLRDEEQ